MKKTSLFILLGLFSLGLSIFFYFINYLMLKNLNQILLNLTNDLAFLFIYVFIVVLILDNILSLREKQIKLEKLNMAIGTFFAEIGTELLNKFVKTDSSSIEIRSKLQISTNWDEKNFKQSKKIVQKFNFNINSKEVDLNSLKEFLESKSEFLILLLENPNLLEHEAFTDLLWATFHLLDELNNRQDFSSLPDKDYEHLSGDINRVYKNLILQWLDYMKHLKKMYPYLFSLAVRKNPFNPEAKVIFS